MVDKTLILRKLAQLDEYFHQVEEYSKITLGEYSTDWKAQRIVERTLQMMIELCADIASHMIADAGLPFQGPTRRCSPFYLKMIS